MSCNGVFSEYFGGVNTYSILMIITVHISDMIKQETLYIKFQKRAIQVVGISSCAHRTPFILWVISPGNTNSRYQSAQDNCIISNRLSTLYPSDKVATNWFQSNIEDQNIKFSLLVGLECLIGCNQALVVQKKINT